MPASSIIQAMRPKSLIPQIMLAWYAVLFLALAVAPIDVRIWWGSNILPLAFVTVLVLTYRAFPLSNTSYILITAWLTLHTVAVHYTYPKVPLGFWLDAWFDFHRNHFDRIVHFSFGFFMTLPLVEVFRRRCNVKGWLLPYLVVMTVLGFSAFWEIVEAWIGQMATSGYREGDGRASGRRLGPPTRHGIGSLRLASVRGVSGLEAHASRRVERVLPERVREAARSGRTHVCHCERGGANLLAGQRNHKRHQRQDQAGGNE